MEGPARTDFHAAAQAIRRIAGELEAVAAALERAEAAGAGTGSPETLEAPRGERDQLRRALADLRGSSETLPAERGPRKEPPGWPVPAKVMIVDDALADLRLMEAILRGAGHQVVACGSGEEVEQTVLAERPDLLLLDIIMPHRNGYEILRALKRDERTREMPVVVVTAKNQESDRLWSKRQGAAEHLMKPFTPDQLLGTVRRLVR